MVRLFAVLGVTLLACTAGRTQSASNEIQFRAVVQAVAPLSTFSGAVTPVGVDPRFALTVHIESVVATITDFSAGAQVTFAIHSPSLLFAGEPTQGKTYDFVLHREMKDGKVRFIGLKIANLQ